MNDIKIKRTGDGGDRTRILRFLASYALVVGVLLTIFIWTGGALLSLIHVLFFSLAAIPLCILCVFIIEKLGSYMGSFFSGWTPGAGSPLEVFSADLSRVRQYKRENKYNEAMKIIEDVLEKAPGFPDALFLKAQVSWEGFRDFAVAKRCLQKVLQMVPYGQTLHTWASGYFDEMIRAQKKWSLKKGNPN